MFAVLEIDKYEKGLLKRFRRFFEKYEPTMNYCTVKGAVPFIVLRMKESSHGIDWNEVRNSTGVCAQRLLLSKEITIPEEYGVFRFKPTIYPIIPIFNNMIDIFQSLDLKKTDLNVTVLDELGALSEKIDVLANHARHITVLTNNSDSYKKTSQRLMENYGAAIVIYDYYQREINDRVVLSDKFDQERLRKKEIVFCADSSAQYTNTVTAKDLQTDDYVMEAKSEKVDLFDFTAALYEYNGFKRAGEYEYKRVFLGDEEVTCEKLSSIIREVLL